MSDFDLFLNLGLKCPDLKVIFLHPFLSHTRVRTDVWTHQKDHEVILFLNWHPKASIRCHDSIIVGSTRVVSYLSPVCVNMCLLSSESLLNIFPQREQRKPS